MGEWASSRPWRNPRPLSEALRGVRARLVPPTLLARVQGRWSAAVGREIAEHARPVAEREGVVTVSCRSATWTAELSMLSTRLLEGLNRELGDGAPVRALRFVTGPL